MCAGMCVGDIDNNDLPATSDRVMIIVLSSSAGVFVVFIGACVVRTLTVTHHLLITHHSHT
jgi:hypothetical protein